MRPSIPSLRDIACHLIRVIRVILRVAVRGVAWPRAAVFAGVCERGQEVCVCVCTQVCVCVCVDNVDTYEVSPRLLP